MGNSECGMKREPKECSLRWLGAKAWPRVVYDAEEAEVGSESESGGRGLDSTVLVRPSVLLEGLSWNSSEMGGGDGGGSWACVST